MAAAAQLAVALALLASGLAPSAKRGRPGRRAVPCAVVRACAAAAAADALYHWREPGAARWLAAAAAGGLVAATLPLPSLPGHGVVPWFPLAVAVAVGGRGGPQARGALGLAVGRLGGWPLAWAGLCALVSTAALAAWSLRWVRGDHGPIQKLAKILSPARVVPLAMANALREEVEFRVFFLGALVAGPPARSPPWLAVAIVAHAAYFARLHVAAGFPSGPSGGVLVFVWAVFLGVLRCWAGGMALVYMLHVQADVVIFVLLLVEERRRAEAAKKSDRLATPSSSSDGL